MLLKKTFTSSLIVPKFVPVIIKGVLRTGEAFKGVKLSTWGILKLVYWKSEEELIVIAPWVNCTLNFAKASLLAMFSGVKH